MNQIQLSISVDNSLKEKYYKYISKKQINESILYIVDKIEKFINKDLLFRSLCCFIHVKTVQLLILYDNAYSIGLQFEDNENPGVSVFLEGMEKLSDEKVKANNGNDIYIFRRKFDPDINSIVDLENNIIVFHMKNIMFAKFSPFGMEQELSTFPYMNIFALWSYNLYSLYNAIDIIIEHTIIE